MPRHMLRRAPPDPSTPPSQPVEQLQPPPLRAPAPAFETPPGFHPRHGVEPMVTGAIPWPRQTPDMEAVADALGGGTESGDTEGEEEQELEDEPVDVDGEVDADEEHDVEEEVEDEDEEMRDRNKSPSPLPPNLREISSLASWTVSTHKPGCGVAALRHPSPTQFWQSDGPQPHVLTLHFFKLVAIVKIRVYLDFELDESYTPTKMVFLAGMGGNDLVEFATWEGEGPCGWVDIPLEGVGGRSRRIGGNRGSRRRRRTTRLRRRKTADSMVDAILTDSENEDGYSDQDIDGEDNDDDSDDPDDPYAGNVLKAMVIQMRVCENHQNGKDTHVRGFQVFAQDDDRRRIAAAAAASNVAQRRQSVRKSLRGRAKDSQDEQMETDAAVDGKGIGLEEPDWMGEPVIR
ncbi:hypothetical protein VTN77DRAFT_8040 [Rasamsonia byssochlamydoides]|uniref:uncharacterized protein n=1 Tax=Rasamsonia byssochlamydoides TaxID=89139 RepID=UPI003743B1B8